MGAIYIYITYHLGRGHPGAGVEHLSWLVALLRLKSAAEQGPVAKGSAEFGGTVASLLPPCSENGLSCHI